MKQRKKIGLALGSGGAKGLSHIGVIKALEESNIPIDMIAGASAGALVGGAYLALGSIQKLEKYVTSLTYKDLAWIFLDLGSSSGIIKGDKIEQYLKELCSDKVIESLSIPFAAIATEVSTGKAVALRRGSLASAIRASGSVPALIGSVYLDGKHLVDGGASCPVPVPIVKDLGADYVIAVNLAKYLSIFSIRFVWSHPHSAGHGKNCPRNAQIQFGKSALPGCRPHYYSGCFAYIVI